MLWFTGHVVLQSTIVSLWAARLLGEIDIHSTRLLQRLPFAATLPKKLKVILDLGWRALAWCPFGWEYLNGIKLPPLKLVLLV